METVISWKAEGGVWTTPVYNDGWLHGPDSAELRVWIADETELGARAADKFIAHGRCPLGALDNAVFWVVDAKFPYPDNPRDNKEAVAKCLEARREWMAAQRANGRRSCMCQEDSHYKWMGDGGVHDPRPVGKPLGGLFWTSQKQVRAA